MSSGAGSAVRFYLNQSDARIGLPEVVRLETEVHLRTTIKEHIAKIKASHQQLLAAFGRLKEVVLPKDDEIEALIQSVWTNIGSQLEPMPFTLEFATQALIRTVEKVAPSDKNQKFKDCVLWSNCLSALATEDVHLVTNDAAFYEGRDRAQGLAKSLRLEVRDLPFELKLHPTLTDFLSEIRTEVEIEKIYVA